ncbi:MAG: CsbD family protein [Blastococcus sp.]
MSGIDKMKNKAEELAGKGKEAVGDATDNRDLQAEGKAEETKGNLKQAGEKVKDALK